MLIHGYNANDLIVSTNIYFPTDIRSSLSSRYTYRGIYLFNAICTLFDYVIMHTFNDYFYVLNIHFGY